MSRPTSLSNRAYSLTGLIVVSLVTGACGRQPAPASTARQEPSGPVRVVPAGGLPAATAATPTSVALRVLSFAEAEAAYQAGNFAAAREAFLVLAETRSQDHLTHYMLGLSAWKSGDLRRAETALDRALELDPAHVKSWINAARVLLDLDRAHEALERVEQALVRDPVSGDALRLKARAQSRLGDRESARQVYRQAIAIDERDAWSMNNLGVLELEYGDHEAALGPLARAVQLRSTAPVFQNNLGMALERSGHFGAAVKAYAAAVAADSSYVKARRNLDRLRVVVGEGTGDDTFSVTDLAEEFRVRVRMWKDGLPREGE